MKKTHSLKTWMPYFQDILDGKKSFEFRQNDRGFQVGDDIVLVEFDSEKQEPTDRRIYASINYLLTNSFGIPEGYCVFGFHTTRQGDFIRDYDEISNRLLPGYEEKISYRVAGTLMERMAHVLRNLDDVATKSVLKSKDFIDDVKVQFKALELIIEGLTSEGLNHGQKRVIANHVITMIRDMVSRIDHINWDYSTGIYQRYNFFRSHSPERTLYQKYRELKDELRQLKGKDSQPSDSEPEELPF